MNPDLNRLEHMIDACEKIIRFTDVDYNVYETSDEKQAAVARYYEVLGEAANKISDALKSQYSDVPWKVATALRNILIHDYVKVDYSELWKTAKEDIPQLLLQLKRIISSLP
jgi:uncharacterized protein with HEPN domain